MFIEDDEGREWWVPEGTGRLEDPPYPLKVTDYFDDVAEWQARAKALASCDTESWDVETPQEE